MNDELTLLTKELLLETDDLKKCTMNSMVIGDTYIVRGITIFEEVLKEINPNELNDELVTRIGKIISEYMNSKSGKNMNFVRYGIFLCNMRLYNYKKNYIFRKKR